MCYWSGSVCGARRKCSKEKIVVFADGDIDDALYEMAHAQLFEQKMKADAKIAKRKASMKAKSSMASARKAE